MKLFRIEDEKTKNGMWTATINEKLVLDLLTDKTLLNLPMPYDNTFNKYDKNWKTAVSSVEGLYSWFSEQDMKEMINHGFRIMAFENDNIITQEFQILFDSGTIKNEVDITGDFFRHKQ